MSIQRYVVIQAVKTKENELIPIWDERIVFSKTEMYGNVISLKDSFGHNHLDLIECIYDLKTKQIEVGVELNYYPVEKELEFKKDETVFFEKSHRSLVETKISDVVYEEYEMEIKRGSKLDRWWVERFKDVEIYANTLYAIKKWKPFYVLDNGAKIEWSHQLYHKFDEVSGK